MPTSQKLVASQKDCMYQHPKYHVLYVYNVFLTILWNVCNFIQGSVWKPTCILK